MFKTLFDISGHVVDIDRKGLYISKEELYKVIDDLSTFKGSKGYDIDPHELKERLEAN